MSIDNLIAAGAAKLEESRRQAEAAEAAKLAAEQANVEACQARVAELLAEGLAQAGAPELWPYAVGVNRFWNQEASSIYSIHVEVRAPDCAPVYGVYGHHATWPEGRWDFPWRVARFVRDADTAEGYVWLPRWMEENDEAGDDLAVALAYARERWQRAQAAVLEWQAEDAEAEEQQQAEAVAWSEEQVHAAAPPDEPAPALRFVVGRLADVTEEVNDLLRAGWSVYGQPFGLAEVADVCVCMTPRARGASTRGGKERCRMYRDILPAVLLVILAGLGLVLAQLFTPWRAPLALVGGVLGALVLAAVLIVVASAADRWARARYADTDEEAQP